MAQEAAMGALNLPSAADIERVTRRLRSVSPRLEGIEDAIDRLDERVATAAGASGDDRLARIEARLDEMRRDLAALAALVAPGERARCRVRRSASRSRTPERRVAGLAHAHSQLRPARLGPSGRAPFDDGTSLTPSTHAAATPRRAATWRIVAASISTASAPRSIQSAAASSRGS